LRPIHPGEKRLLSYAADQAVKVRLTAPAYTSTLRHIAMHQGVMVAANQPGYRQRLHRE